MESVGEFESAIEHLKENFGTTSNGFIRVIPNSLQIEPDQRAEFAIHRLTQPSNSEHSLLLEVKFNGMYQKVDLLPGGGWLYRTARLSAGSHAVKFQLIQLPRRLAESVYLAITDAEVEIFGLRRTLQSETDPDRVQAIELRIQSIEKRIAHMRTALAGQMREIGTPIQMVIQVN